MDVVFSDSDLSRYDVVVAPMLHMVKQGVAERVSGLLETGGTFVTTVSSGVVDETDLAFEGYPGPLRPYLGIWIEEMDALYPDQTNRMVMTDGSSEYACSRWCERVRVESASVVATFGDGLLQLQGEPAVARKGNAYYIATEPSDEFLDAFFGQILTEYGIRAELEAPAGVEVAGRECDGRRLVFVLNHTSQSARLELPFAARDLLRESELSGALKVASRDVYVLERMS